MTLLELTLETAIREAGKFKDVRLLKEDAEYILAMLKDPDRIKVTRCKDCMFCEVWESDIGEKRYCCNYNWIKRETKANGFCHEGVERDAETD